MTFMLSDLAEMSQILPENMTLMLNTELQVIVMCVGAMDSERWRHVYVGGPGHPEVSDDDGLTDCT